MSDGAARFGDFGVDAPMNSWSVQNDPTGAYSWLPWRGALTIEHVGSAHGEAELEASEARAAGDTLR